jgi:hypothetical protein
MSKYAKLNSDLIVENIILCDDSQISTQYGHHIKETQDTGIANIGDYYDNYANKFIAPKPFESWVLNDSFEWESPVGENPDKLNKFWDEEAQAWVDRV